MRLIKLGAFRAGELPAVWARLPVHHRAGVRVVAIYIARKSLGQALRVPHLMGPFLDQPEPLVCTV
ncbi:hypothetical protein D3C76_1755750 [compost metagenome]